MLQDEFYNGAFSNHVLSSFGVHPQNPMQENLLYLDELLRDKKIDCIGECGFDYYTDEFKSKAAFQESVFAAQLELAAKYNRPVIIHSRKSIDRIFYHSKALSKPPVVLFHSFSGTYKDALSLLNRGINAVFSFSQQIIKGSTKAIECVKLLPIERILLETDAPYQTLKGESATNPELIYQVYKTAFAFRSGLDFTAFCECLYSNYLQFAQGRL
ncbi:MAG: TatD family hydrolase [Treponema sp.]|nr:TatD family hydrolase [Treponema sp.]MCR5612122.1 TatD family hydrolase [Treponema sp.]